MSGSSKTLGDIRENNVDFMALEPKIQSLMSESPSISATSPISLSRLSLTENTPIRGAWVAAGVSGALVFLTLLAVVALVYWRRTRGTLRDAGSDHYPDTQALEDGGEQDPVSAPTNGGFAAISYNVTPPLPPPEDDEESEDEEDVAQHWSNGVVLTPESHPVLI